MHSTWQRQLPLRPAHPMADQTYAPQPQRFYSLSEHAFDAHGEFYGQQQYHAEEPAYDYNGWSPDMKRHNLQHSHEQQQPIYQPHSPHVHTVHAPAPSRTVFVNHEVDLGYPNSSDWEHSSPPLSHVHEPYSSSGHYSAPRVKQEDVYTPIPSYPPSHHRSASQQHSHSVVYEQYSNSQSQSSYYSPPPQYIVPAELSPGSPHSGGCDPRFVSGDSDGEEYDYPPPPSLPPLEHPDSDLDAEGEAEEDYGDEEEEDQEDYLEDAEDTDDGDYVLRRGRSAGLGEGRNTRLRAAKRYNPYAYTGANSSELYLSSSASRPRRLTSSSNTSSTTSIASSSGPSYCESGRRRSRPATALPVPIPVPNLTKKSRGRRVPTATSTDRRPQVMDGDFGEISTGRRSAAKGARMYTCKVTGCGKLFARGEHLKRHVRSIHTYEKPHKCPYPGCGKDFSRHDNLGQHMRVHKDYSPYKDSAYRN